MDRDVIDIIDKIDFWTEILNTWTRDKLNNTENTKGNILPKHNTYQNIVEYFKHAEYAVRKRDNRLALDIIHPRYLTPDTIGRGGLIRSMDVDVVDDDLEARIVLNVPLTDTWIIRAHRHPGKDRYKFVRLTYEDRNIPHRAA